MIDWQSLSAGQGNNQGSPMASYQSYPSPFNPYQMSQGRDFNLSFYPSRQGDRGFNFPVSGQSEGYDNTGISEGINPYRLPNPSPFPPFGAKGEQSWGGQSWGQPEGIYPQTPQGTGLQTPPEWDVASRAYGYAAQGIPTTAGGWREAQMPIVQRRIEDQAKQAAEQAGLSGTRWSTPLQRNIADIAGREMGQLEGDWATKQWQARETAADRALGGAGGLSTLGQQYFNAPMDWASQMYGMGAGMTGQYQQGLERQQQDIMRQFPEASPWLQQAMGYAGISPAVTQQQYQPSGGTQALGALSSLAPLLGLFI